jgi:hypothetical protein
MYHATLHTDVSRKQFLCERLNHVVIWQDGRVFLHFLSHSETYAIHLATVQYGKTSVHRLLANLLTLMCLLHLHNLDSDEATLLVLTEYVSRWFHVTPNASHHCTTYSTDHTLVKTG